ncbi:hypothetical protein OYC64_019650 [Pagothenia borchgrevinki]|uniref:Uncharacterized protein n=1 Tax=Pagothenia borchgrevinki TaxID=8213 RepID=A0ABD2FJF0_PAGBO
MAEERRRSKEENAAAADKAARKDVKRFLADGDEDLELESGAEDEFVPVQTLLCSEDQKEIIEGVILAIRGEGDPDTQLGDSSVRTRRTPDINCDASSIGDLISWSEGVSEPPLTCLLSTSEVKNVIKTPMEVLNWPCHTQSIERVVKMVTEASAKYFSQEKRDGGIRVQETSRRPAGD